MTTMMVPPAAGEMFVVKRNGAREPVEFDKVLERIRRAAEGLQVQATRLAQLVLAEIHDGVRTTELDELAARLAVSFATTHPDWATLAARIIVSNCQKNAPASFSEAIAILAATRPTPVIAGDVADFVAANASTLNGMIDPARDFLMDYFGFKTLEKGYLMRDRAGGRILETPQFLWLRVAVGLWGCSHDGTTIPTEERLARIRETYDLMSQKAFTHATPTLFNAGTPRPQCSSCFVAGTSVHTLSGVKPIEEVEIGDEVVTHTGSVKRVLQLHENSLGDRMLYDIKIAGTPTLTVTGNHRLMSISDEQDKWGQKPSWNRVDYLRVGDWVAIPKKHSGEEIILDMKDILENITGDGDNIQYTYDYDTTFVYPYYNYFLQKKNSGPVPCKKAATPFNRFWRFDLQAMELLGIWYGDGSVTNAKNSTGNRVPKCVSIVSYHTNSALISFVESAFKSFLGNTVHVTKSADVNGMVTLAISHTIIAHIFKYLFRCRFDGKRLPPFFNRLGYDSVKAFLAGLVSSDGCVSSTHAVQIQLTNPPLVNEIYHLARSVGIPITLTMMTSQSQKSTGRMTLPYSILEGSIKKHYVDERLSYTSASKNNWNMVRVIDGITYMRINGKTLSTDHPEVVYTLGIEDDHSYSVGGIIAENCFLQAMKGDSVEGIFDTIKDCAVISKYAGGIGLHIHNIRAAGAHIAGNNGRSDGILPMLRVFNNTARYINQGGRRNGSIAVYLEPWHADIQAFLKMKSNTGAEEERARDLFYALWVPDLFMRRVESGGNWSLFCPHEAPGLADAVGADFVRLYEQYEAEGRARTVIPAQKLWAEILVSQIETGTPYLLYKDAANAKSNQKNLGTIKSSNLCVAPETQILTDKGQFPISTLVDQTVNVWNGDQWSEVVVRRTSERAKLIKVTLSVRASEESTSTLYCTPYHKFILPTHDRIADCDRIDAADLKPGQALKYFRFQYLGNKKAVRYAYVEARVVSVEDFGRYDETYCFNEPLNHAGVFNGILTGNCSEIIEYSDEHETAVCNLASIALPYFLRHGPSEDGLPLTMDWERLHDVTAVIVRNLNRVIDINFYPTPETRRSNMRHRPIGIGVQGLADVFARLGLAWESPEAARLNQEIFEHIYFAAVSASMALSHKDGPYETFAGSPASQGLLQPDLWGVTPITNLPWVDLKEQVSRQGLRNSLLMAPMPTASTSQILGYNECIEPFTTNIYARRTLAGEFTVINTYLVRDLMAAGLWTPALKDRIIAANGSIQGIAEIPADICARYKTVWEIKQKTLIDMAADRGAFICQSQSLNLFVADPTIAKLSSMHFHAWKRGLKTGIYYLRTKSAVQAIKFTVDPAVAAAQQQQPAECLLCSA